MLSSMQVGLKTVKIPKRNEDRIILHFDYDCFYASVFEHENPSLKSLPLGIKQKSILATCNYVARARGVKKLMLISDAQKICPDLVLMNGEDLTRFRDASKKLWAFLRAHSWNDRVERLGLDEVFLDVSDVIAYNQETLNVHALSNSFFQLDRHDPVKGFTFDGSQFYGCVKGSSSSANDVSKEVDTRNPLCVRLMLASHLVGYLRHKVDEDFGYTSSGGISTNKTLAKLAGTVNKPNNQTALLSYQDDAVEEFVQAHKLRKIPGIGGRTAKLIEEYILSTPAAIRDLEGTMTVSEVLQHPGMSPELLEQILDRPGAERGGGDKIWNLLHGVDNSEVKEASDIPTQISIEDTYMSQPLQTAAEIGRELRTLAASLVRRMRVDLTDAGPAIRRPDATSDDDDGPSHSARWLAYPKTLRLSTCARPKPRVTSSLSGTGTTDSPPVRRSSRSTALPSFIFSAPSSPEEIPKIAERLVTESVLPLFRRLHPERQAYNLALLNICVTNMVIVAGADDSTGIGGGSAAKGSARDIGSMFRTQEEKLKEWTVYDASPAPEPAHHAPGDLISGAVQIGTSASNSTVDNDENDTELEEKDEGGRNNNKNRIPTENAYSHISALIPTATITTPAESAMSTWEEEEDEDGDGGSLLGKPELCELCGHMIPVFAVEAHERFHSLDQD